jgi:hypothetical protein
MRLADEELTVTINGQALHLRPSLRAAFRLERRYGGFDALITAVVAENLTVIADVFRECAVERTQIPDLLDELGLKPLRIGIEAIAGPTARLVFMLAGVDPKAQASPVSESANRITFAEYHERLFAIGTGWLGWSPETTWDATPAEITAAYQGRSEMLRSIFGGGVNNNDQPFEPSDDEIQRGWAKLKHLAATGGNRA